MKAKTFDVSTAQDLSYEFTRTLAPILVPMRNKGALGFAL